MTTPDANPGPASDPQPLHERWPQALGYPLQAAALSTVVALAVAHVGVRLIPGVVGWFFDLIVWAGFFKYAFEVLRWSANGRREAPEITLTVGDEVGRYAVLVLLLVEVALILIAMWWGAVLALIVGIALMAAMPAMVTILALEEGMARALNPLVWLLIASRVGLHYFVLVGFFCAALIVQSVLAAELLSAIPWPVGPLLTWLIVNYLMIATFHLIGSVIHEHRDELGYAGHLELQEPVPHTDAARAILDAARARAAGGDVRGAVALLHDELAAHADLLPAHDEYRHWLRQDGDKTELAAHGKKYIPVLLAHNQDRRAIDVARECQLLDPAFALDQAEDVTRLAHAAADAGQTQIALGLLSGFHKRFRNHADIGRNYLLAAKLWAERMNKEMQARAMLHQIKVAFPNDPVIPQVDAYLAFLDKIAATPARPAS
ncbi:MAG: hypothetical protein JSS28_04385 [Proteobacteria bacterium]|nr:hypothetical protein [Pseudomonadota bacterium]